MPTIVDDLAVTLVLGALLDQLNTQYRGYELLAHHTQGEFHHDVIVRVGHRGELPGDVLLVSTNCNGGIKEVLVFDDVPSTEALWHHRCPTEREFGDHPLPPVKALARTLHYFDPCELLGPDARSELRPEHRRRQRGGGWERV